MRGKREIVAWILQLKDDKERCLDLGHYDSLRTKLHLVTSIKETNI